MPANKMSREAAAPVAWPAGARSAVALAFDLDGPTGNALIDRSIWRNPSFFTLGAYDVWRALPRLLDLLDAEGLPATFFVPGWVVETWPDACREIVRRGHEVGYHGYEHEAFWQLSAADQRRVMARSREIFERHLGVVPTGFRTPSGDWAPETSQVLAEFGCLYSSSMRGDDRPYLIDIPGRDRPLVEIPGRWELDDYASLAYQRNPNFPAGLDRIASYATTFDNWRREFDGTHRDGLCLTTLFHPKVSAKPGRLLLLERLFRHMRAAGGVWFARCAEVADWWLKTEGRA
jgi:peptidoglycan/xylan/chitin deacetylase (PgdA/CDA1 family)